MSDVMTWPELRERVAYLKVYLSDCRELQSLLAAIDASAPAIKTQEEEARLWRFACSDEGWGLDAKQLEAEMRKRQEANSERSRAQPTPGED